MDKTAIARLCRVSWLTVGRACERVVAAELDPVRAGNAFGRPLMPVRLSGGTSRGGPGRVETDDVRMGWPLSGVVQAAWRYSLMSPLQVECRRSGWPGRYATTSRVLGARWPRLRWGRWVL